VHTRKGQEGSSARWSATSARPDHEGILKAIVGNGYAHDESGRRLLRKHAAAIVEKIEDKANGDLLRQMQLAEAVKRRLSPDDFESDQDLYVALAITERSRVERCLQRAIG
jgi:hypothetical protein